MAARKGRHIFYGKFGEARWGCKGLFLRKTLTIAGTVVLVLQEVNFRVCTFFHEPLVKRVLRWRGGFG